jgi:3-oxoacyl-[acyl-carrier protein] reductase
LDVLVNNAAINKKAPLDQVTEKSFDEHFAANVKSALFMSQAAARVFKPGAVIVNISSLNSRYPSGHLYSATKAALEWLTISLSRELGPRGIRVVAVAPGMVDTEMLRANNEPEALSAMIERNVLRRIGKADEIAAVVAFLATHDAGSGRVLRQNRPFVARHSRLARALPNAVKSQLGQVRLFTTATSS